MYERNNTSVTFTRTSSSTFRRVKTPFSVQRVTSVVSQFPYKYLSVRLPRICNEFLVHSGTSRHECWFNKRTAVPIYKLVLQIIWSKLRASIVDGNKSFSVPLQKAWYFSLPSRRQWTDFTLLFERYSLSKYLSNSY